MKENKPNIIYILADDMEIWDAIILTVKSQRRI